MQGAIKMSPTEAINILRKWRDERRVILVSIASGGFRGRLYGQLDSNSIEDGTVRLSLSETSIPLGEQLFVQFPLADSKFEYSHAENVPEPMKSRVSDYDAVLYANHEGIAITFAVTDFD